MVQIIMSKSGERLDCSIQLDKYSYKPSLQFYPVLTPF